MKKTFWVVALPVGALVFLVVVMTATLVTFILPKTYLSEARIKLAPRAMSSAAPGALALEQAEVIRSELVLLPALDQLDARKRWGDRYANGEQLPAALCLQIFRSRLDVKPVPNTDIIRICVFAETPNEAAELANSVTSAYSACCATNSAGVNVAVLDKAAVSYRPASPKVALNIVLGMVIGVLLGAIIGGGCGWLVCRLRRYEAPINARSRSSSVGCE